MWHIVRRWCRAGENAGKDAAMEELRGGLGLLKKALARGKPTNDINEEAAERMAIHDAIVPEQNNIDRAAACDTSEEPRETEGLCLSWSLISLILSHLPNY